MSEDFKKWWDICKKCHFPKSVIFDNYTVKIMRNLCYATWIIACKFTEHNIHKKNISTNELFDEDQK